ncbi:hypothetical protein RND71_023325 [Anisodus tanguticus]|uniref:Uncharacterized protein n=1 Tax=Anisodus tanguticus TaxID=243964 RepID=A0AAE1VEN1_9SOLA|nr:hypothetical protein RND71_023325 [Anisodus tanguticus]
MGGGVLNEAAGFTSKCSALLAIIKKKQAFDGMHTRPHFNNTQVHHKLSNPSQSLYHKKQPKITQRSILSSLLGLGESGSLRQGLGTIILNKKDMLISKKGQRYPEMRWYPLKGIAPANVAVLRKEKKDELVVCSLSDSDGVASFRRRKIDPVDPRSDYVVPHQPNASRIQSPYFFSKSSATTSTPPSFIVVVVEAFSQALSSLSSLKLHLCLFLSLAILRAQGSSASEGSKDRDGRKLVRYRR